MQRNTQISEKENSNYYFEQSGFTLQKLLLFILHLILDLLTKVGYHIFSELLV